MAIVLANWKSHKTLSEAEAWMKTFCQLYHPESGLEVIIAPSFPYLVLMWQMLQEIGADQHIKLAAQDLSSFPFGPYTGAVAADMVSDLAGYAILGHSERRRYFHETNQDVANKLSEAVAAGIKPIVCVDEPYARAQIAALNDVELNDLIIGYGPAEAIGGNIPQQPEKAGAVIEEILEIIPDKPILYGGSMNKDNAADYLRIAGVTGLMVGAASLDPSEFADICKTVASAS
jgi:triosephosphate isomerase